MFARKGRKSRSPIKVRLLRNPGQSLDDAFNAVLNERLLFWILVPVVSIVLTLLEWYRFYSPAKPNPLLVTLLTAIVCLVSLIKIPRIVRQARDIRQGRDGERAVAEYLDRQRASGAEVIHDVPADGFNLDHVIVCEHGIYVVETKTLSKPVRGSPRINFDGQEVRVLGRLMDRDPLAQARGEASWLKLRLRESTGREFSVRPTVVFPGWFVEKPRGLRTDVWVLEPKALVKWIEREPKSLTTEDVKLIAYHIRSMVRVAA